MILFANSYISRVRLDPLREVDSGDYGCKSEADEWSNVTIYVDPEYNVLSHKMETYSLVAENLQMSEQTDELNTNVGLDDTEQYATEDEPKKPYFKRDSELHKLMGKPSGNMFRFRCLAGGNPEPNITWTKNGESIVRSMGKVKYQRWAITLEELVPDDSGLYNCKACNQHGCVDWTTKLEVQGRSYNTNCISNYQKKKFNHI